MCDKSLATDPGNLEIIRRKFPGFCRFHVAHNVLGGSFERHGACTAAPVSGGDCEHGSHTDPTTTAEARKGASCVLVRPRYTATLMACDQNEKLRPGQPQWPSLSLVSASFSP